MNVEEIKAQVALDKNEDTEFLSHFPYEVQPNIRWRPSIARPSVATYSNMLTLLAEIARLEKRLSELERLAGGFLKAYGKWAETVDVADEDLKALRELEEYTYLLTSFLGIVDTPNK